MARLPDEGVLLVCTDLHGNFGDFERMLAIYEEEEAAGNQPVLAFCGDLVHGPSPDVEESWPSHLGTPYRDESVELIRAFEALSRDHRMFSLVGNHEHAHIGGPVVPKFYPNEAQVLEDALGADALRMRSFFESFPLVAVAPCGVVLTHAAPASTLPDAESFEALEYAGYDDLAFHQMMRSGVVGALLWARACAAEDARALLASLTGSREGFVAFGHDIVREGYVVESDHHVCVSTSFGLYDPLKRYLRLDLGGRYRSTSDLRDGVEIRPLHQGLR